MFGVFSITSSWRPSAEIVIDEEGGLLRNTLASYYNHDEQMMFTEQLRLLASSGVPYDTWLADDFIRKPELAEKYRVIVFAGMYSIDESRRKLIKRLKNGGRTLVFLSGTGISGGDDATGLKLVHQPAPQNHVIVQEPGESVNVLSFTDHWLLTRYLGGSNFAKCWQPRRTTVEEEPGMRVIARFAKGNVPAIAEKAFKTWKSVIVGSAGGLTPQYFNRVVREAKGYAPVEGGLQVNMNGRFLSIHCLKSGEYDFKLPFTCNVRNLKNGKVSGNADSIRLDMTPGETRWYTLEKSK